MQHHRPHHRRGEWIGIDRTDSCARDSPVGLYEFGGYTEIAE